MLRRHTGDRDPIRDISTGNYAAAQSCASDGVPVRVGRRAKVVLKRYTNGIDQVQGHAHIAGGSDDIDQDDALRVLPLPVDIQEVFQIQNNRMGSHYRFTKFAYKVPDGVEGVCPLITNTGREMVDSGYR